MLKIRICILLLFTVLEVGFASKIEYIRSFDLGGTGLKTALLRYDENTNTMDFIESSIHLGRCPEALEVCDWIRQQFHQVLGRDLEEEIRSGYVFGFSLAGLNKLRSKPFESIDMSTLFDLPSDRVRSIDDGAAHLVASLKVLQAELPAGTIWNIAIGSDIGLGFTDVNRKVRNPEDFFEFFDESPEAVKEPTFGKYFWEVCGSMYLGFEYLKQKNGGIADDHVFMEFAHRWKAFLEESVLNYSTRCCPEKKWGTPVAVVFTGGVMDFYPNRLVDALHNLGIKIPVYNGGKQSGLLGAAWNLVNNDFGPPPLIEAINECEDLEKVELLLTQGADANECDALCGSPLLAAIKTGKCALVELLIIYGAKVNAHNGLWQTPLFEAIKANDFHLTELLLSYGAEINEYDYWAQSPLSIALRNKNLKIAGLLLANGAYPAFLKKSIKMAL